MRHWRYVTALLLGGMVVLGWPAAPGGPSAALAARGYGYDPTPQPYRSSPPSSHAQNEERDLLPRTVAALHDALDGLGIDWFVAAGISDDPLSAGTHLPDGIRASGVPYTAAVDVSINGLTTKAPRGHCRRGARRCLTAGENRQFIRLASALRAAGFAAWYRHTYDRRHRRWENEIHAIDPAAPYLKPSLRRQLDDYAGGRDGLVGNRRHDAGGRVRPHLEAFCRREALGGGTGGAVALGGSYRRYHSWACRVG